MNKSNIQKIYTRIGHWIKFERKNRLEISGDMKYSQEKFILLDVNERFSDFVFNEAICARSSLSRIENGRVIYETPLITFFLKRLNKRYRIIEMEHFLIDCILDAFHCYIFKNNLVSIVYLKELLESTNDKIIDNFLWDEDYSVLKKIICWIDNYTLIQKHEFVEIYKKFRIYHKQIQDILIFYLAYSVYFNPELWSSYRMISNLIKQEYESNELLSVFDFLFTNQPNQIFRTFYRNEQMFSESGFLNKIVKPIKIMVEKRYDHICSAYNNLGFMSLVHRISANDYNVNSRFESSIFTYLKHNSIDDRHDIDDLLVLIKDEPYPRVINELVLKQLFPKIRSKSHMQKILNFILN